MTCHSYFSSLTISSASVGFLAASKNIDDGQLLSDSLIILLNIQVNSAFAISSIVPFQSFSTCRLSIGESTEEEFSVSRYNFSIRPIQLAIWLFSKVILAVVYIKISSKLIDGLQMLLYDGETSMNVSVT